VQILTISGPLDSAGGTPFTITGTAFPGSVSDPVLVRFTAVAGAPFDACRSATLERTAILASDTTIQGASPATTLAGDVTCSVTVVFRGGLEVTSLAPIATILGVSGVAYDQDLDGEHDRCDPDTYDFEDDALGARPAGTARVDGTTPGFVTVDAAGDRAAHYANASGSGSYDTLERLRCDRAHQDLTAYIDFGPTPQAAHVEFWSDGSYAGNAGAGLLLQVLGNGEIRLYQRVRRSLPVSVGPLLPASGRIRVRLLKGPANSSTLHVDAWVAGAWQADHAVFAVTNDTWFTGRDVALAEYGNSTRGVRRITVVRHVPTAALTVVEAPEAGASWKLFQRDDHDEAVISVRCLYRLAVEGRLEARVVEAGTTSVVPGHGWSAHALTVPAADAGRVAFAVSGVPTGGNYDIDVRLVEPGTGQVLGTGRLSEVAVGDLYLCIGQSNMAGYSGSLAGATTPIPQVHLFHNSDVWMQAAEPMDDGTFQRDGVSAESPQHSLMLPFAVALYQSTGVPVGIIPAPLGGTNLYAQWQRNASDPDHRGTLYGSALRRAALQGGPPLRGMLWYQGESDALAGRTKAQYRADLEQLIVRYRADLSAPDAVFLCVQLGTWSGGGFPNWTNVQEAQREVAATDPLAALATVQDLARAGGIHYSVASYQELGRRLAEQARVLLFGASIDPLTELTEAVAVSAGMAVELHYDAAVVGGQASLFEVVDSAGVNAVTGVSTTGSTVTLQLTRALVGSATARYGMSTTPAVAWLLDAAGVAVPAFADVPIVP